MQTLDTLDTDRIRTGAANVRTHGVEEVGKVDDVRLARRVLDHGAAARKRRRDDDVHRRADRDLIQIYLCPAQAAVRRVGIDKAVFHLDVRAHRGHALMCWSIGRTPKLQPPGMVVLAEPKRPSIEPMK